MNISQLEKLAQNPHYKLSATQLAELEEYRIKDIRHDPVVKKHSPRVVKHKPEMEGEYGN